MPTNLYGPGDNYHLENSHVLPALIRRFHEATDKKADKSNAGGVAAHYANFCMPMILARHVCCLEHWQLGPGDPPFLNVGTGVDLSIRELAEAVAKATGYSAIEWDTSKTRWHSQETVKREPTSRPWLEGTHPPGSRTG